MATIKVPTVHARLKLGCVTAFLLINCFLCCLIIVSIANARLLRDGLHFQHRVCSKALQYFGCLLNIVHSSRADQATCTASDSTVTQTQYSTVTATVTYVSSSRNLPYFVLYLFISDANGSHNGHVHRHGY
jgi:hypothetical protein